MRRTLALLLLVAAPWPSAAPAQPPPESRPTVITLRPAAEPVPALKYRLVPEQIKLVPGNAAIFYHRASPHRGRAFLVAPGQGERAAWHLPRVARRCWDPDLAQLPDRRGPARRGPEASRTVPGRPEGGRAGRRCDRHATGNSTSARARGRTCSSRRSRRCGHWDGWSSSRRRLAILDGKTDEAMHWIETGFVIGRHVSQGPTLIQALVGVAISKTMTAHFEDLIQAPGVPSLYWALADRPRPFVDMRRSDGRRAVSPRKRAARAERARPGRVESRSGAAIRRHLQRKLFDLASGREIPGTYVACQSASPTCPPARYRLDGRQDLPRGQARPDRPGPPRGTGRGHARHPGRRAPLAGGVPADTRRIVQVDARPLLAVLQPDRSGDSFRRGSEPRQSTPHPVPDADTAHQPGPSGGHPAGPPARRVAVYRGDPTVRQSPTRASCPRAWSRSPMPRCPSIPRRASRSLYQASGDSATLSAPVAPGFNDPYDLRSWQSYAMNYELRLAR